jgi:hypothetical protein
VIRVYNAADNVIETHEHKETLSVPVRISNPDRLPLAINR